MPNYELLAKQTRALIEDAPTLISALANVSALLAENLDDINWLGFYLAEGDELYLGPFQGKVACTRIAFGKGVCGCAAKTQQTQLVADVHSFAGHIACDSASNSELVVPLIKDGTTRAVLDIDSPSLGRFSEADKVGLELVAKELLPLF